MVKLRRHGQILDARESDERKVVSTGSSTEIRRISVVHLKPEEVLVYHREQSSQDGVKLNVSIRKQ